MGFSMRNTLPLTMLVSLLSLPALVTAQTCNTADRSVALILDASGSMWARLPGGETRIVAAQKAVKGVAALIDPKAQLALRVYGAKSPSKDKNCQDSHLAVPFGPAGQLAPAIGKAVDGVKAQGWTPIAYSLEQAANDFPQGAKERAIVLVSDGKETCKGDPVVTATNLAAKGIAVHTIGYAVDSAAKMQLEGIARASGGKYFDAPDAAELAATLRSALTTCREEVKPRPDKPGKLRTTTSEWLKGHPVINSTTGEKVGDLSHNKRELPLPAGIYEVKFGASSWKGIEVRAGETTTIEPGTLRVKGLAQLSSAKVTDSETGAEHGDLNQNNTDAVLMPGLYDVAITDDGVTKWSFVKIDSGKTHVLESVVVKSDRSLGYQDKVRVLMGGKEVASLNFAKHAVSLAPGDYVIDVNGKKTSFSAPKGGEVYVIK